MQHTVTEATLQFSASGTVQETICEAIEFARNNGFVHEDGALVTTTLNGVAVKVKGDSDPTLIYRDHQRGEQHKLGDNPVVGPYPHEILSKQDFQDDTRRHQEWQERRSSTRCHCGT
jgi:hypothetical protein